MPSLARAIEVIHTTYHVPHIVLTSVSLDTSSPSSDSSDSASAPPNATPTLSVVGSTMTSARKPRPFKIRFPAIDAYFSGTGDMFAALMVVRMRQAVTEAGGDLGRRPSWRSDDDVDAPELPLAKAAEMVLASMHEVLEATCASMQAEVKKAESEIAPSDEKRLHLARSKAAELKLVRHLSSLREPKALFRAQRM